MTEKPFLDIALEQLPFVGVAVLGAVVRSMRFGVKSVWAFIASAACAAFTSFLASMLLADYDVPYGTICTICGIVGYSGGSVIDVALARMLSKIDDKAKG